MISRPYDERQINEYPVSILVVNTMNPLSSAVILEHNYRYNWVTKQIYQDTDYIGRKLFSNAIPKSDLEAARLQYPFSRQFTSITH